MSECKHGSHGNKEFQPTNNYHDYYCGCKDGLAAYPTSIDNPTKCAVCGMDHALEEEKPMDNGFKVVDKKLNPKNYALLINSDSNKWIMSISQEGVISFNHKDHPNMAADDFAKEVIEKLEKCICYFTGQLSYRELITKALPIYTELRDKPIGQLTAAECSMYALLQEMVGDGEQIK